MSRVAVVFGPVRGDIVGAPWLADIDALRAAATLRAAGHDVTLVDAFALPGATASATADGDVALGVDAAVVVAAVPPSDVVVLIRSSSSSIDDAAALEALLRAAHAGGDVRVVDPSDATWSLSLGGGVLADPAWELVDVPAYWTFLAAVSTLVSASAVRDHGAAVHLPFVIGRPGEAARDVNRTLELAMRLHDATGATPSMKLHPGSTTIADLDQFKWTFDRRIEAGRGPKKVILNATYRCNNRCTFCATGTRTQFDGDYQRQKEILVKYRKAGVSLLDIDGGEPTMNPNLLPLVRFARRIGYSKVNVTTNGRMASYDVFARDLAESGVTSLLFSIHGHTAQIHAQNVGVAEAFDQTCDGVRNIVRLAPKGLELGANVTITKSNVRHLPALAQLVWDLGLRWWNIQFLTPFGRATRSVCPDTQEAADVVRSLLDQWRDRMKLQIINLPFCFLPGYEEFMVGDLLKLERHMIFVNNDEVNLFEYLRERRVKKEVCQTCPREVFCGGFYELDDVPEPTWLISAADLVRPVSPTLG